MALTSHTHLNLQVCLSRTREYGIENPEKAFKEWQEKGLSRTREYGRFINSILFCLFNYFLCLSRTREYGIVVILVITEGVVKPLV